MAGFISTTASRIAWLFFFVVFGFVTALFTDLAFRASSSKHWPVTDGIVIAIYETPNYRYSVGGANHVSDMVSCNEFFNRTLASQNSQKYSVRYALGAKVKVHYCPGKPEMAVLETDFDRSYLWVVITLFAFSILCLVGFVLGRPLKISFRQFST